MRLDDFIEDFQRDEAADLRRLAEEKSYAITEYLDDVEQQLDERVQGDAIFGSTAPSIFVGRSNYPEVSTGLLSPVGGPDTDPTDYVTSGEWYQQGYSIDDVFQRRTGLLNSTRSASVDVNDVWDGFVGVQREVAIADRPVNVEIGLSSTPEFDPDRYANPSANAPSGPNV